MKPAMDGSLRPFALQCRKQRICSFVFFFFRFRPVLPFHSHSFRFFGVVMIAHDRDFEIGNLPEGLNVTASEGAPGYLKTSSLELKQDIGQFGLAGKIWQRYVCMCALDVGGGKGIDRCIP